MKGVCKSFSPFFSKSLHIHFNPSQNVSPILLLKGLLMVTNEWLKMLNDTHLKII